MTVQESTSNERTLWQQNGDDIAPGHYIRVLVHKVTGEPSTPNELIKIIDCLRKYIADPPYNIKLGMEVDNTRRHRSEEEHIKFGKHYFLCSSKTEKSRHRNVDRVRIARQFCDITQSRLERVKAELRDQPDVRALSYVGYARELAKREKEHTGDHTSFLMQALLNICQHLKLPYHWETFNTSFATCSREAEFGEIFMNGLAQAYHDTGFGVAVHPAGENCKSASFSSGDDYTTVTNIWRDTVAFRHRVTPYRENLRREEVKLKDSSKIFEAKRRERVQKIQVLDQQIRDTTPDLAAVRELRKQAEPHPAMPELLKQPTTQALARIDQKLLVWDQKLKEVKDAMKQD